MLEICYILIYKNIILEICYILIYLKLNKEKVISLQEVTK
jgi:hypothetical protein